MAARFFDQITRHLFLESLEVKQELIAQPVWGQGLTDRFKDIWIKISLSLKNSRRFITQKCDRSRRSGLVGGMVFWLSFFYTTPLVDCTISVHVCKRLFILRKSSMDNSQ